MSTAVSPAVPPDAAPARRAEPAWSDRARPDRLAAALLAGPALLTLMLLLHHPALPAAAPGGGPPGGHEITNFAAGLVRLGAALRVVHGALLAMLAAQGLGFWRFSARLGWHRLPVAAGFLSYAAGVLLLCTPALLDGFVIPAFAAACLQAADGCGPADRSTFRLIALVIQAFTKAGLAATSAGTAAWALALLTRTPNHDPGGTPGWGRAAGALGLVCAAAPVIALLASSLWIRPDNVAVVFGAQFLWSVLAAAVVTRGAADAAAAPDIGRR